MSKSDIESLKQQRGYMKQRLTKLETYLQTFDPQKSSVFDATVRLDKLKQSISAITTLNNELLATDEGNATANVDEAMDLEERITNAQSKLMFIISSYDPPKPTPQATQENNNAFAQIVLGQNKLLETLTESLHSPKTDESLSAVIAGQTKLIEALSIHSNEAVPNKFGGKLPPLKFKTFSGKTEEYLSFLQTFDQVIEGHKLNEAAKFWYLTQNLQGEPLNLTTSLENDEKPFTVARELLEKRYGQKRLLVNNHLNALFNAPQMREDSSHALRLLLSEITKQIRYLEHQTVPIQHWDLALIFLVTTKLHATSRGKIEEKLPVNELPKWQQFHDFLVERCEVLEAIEQSRRPKTPAIPQIKLESGMKNEKKFLAYASTTSGEEDSGRSSSSQTGNIANTATSSTKSSANSKNKRKQAGKFDRSLRYRCFFCKQDHILYKCEKFLALSPEQRLENAVSLALCVNCLKMGHSVGDCYSGHCGKCEQKHHTLLHEAKTTKALVAISSSLNCQSLSKNVIDSNTQILLATASVLIRDVNSMPQCRALLDSCAQSNFITENMANSLRTPTKALSFDIKGIGESALTANRCIDLEIVSRTSSFRAKLQFIVLPSITEKLPTIQINMKGFAIPNDIALADPAFYVPNEIDMLIGAELFYTILGSRQISLSSQIPMLYETKFGYIAAGKLIDTAYANKFAGVAIQSTFEKLSKQIQNFWQIEEIERPIPALTKDEQACEDSFASTTQRNAEGAFVVHLPKIRPVTDLGQSYNRALACFQSLERRFKREPELCRMYVGFMREYENLGHMIPLSEDKIGDQPGAYYIPHLPVLRPDSVTTKLRTVFNASAKTSTGISLNDILRIGPIVQDDLWDILVRFRLHRFVFTADIAKMYRQVLVSPNDRDLQRIVWRENESQRVKAYQLTTVTYGTAPASYLATRCLTQIATDEADKCPTAVPAIKDFYMDDIMTGDFSIAKLLEIQADLSRMLNSANFSLHKWASNHQSILDAAKELETSHVHQIQEDDSVKTLGLQWHTRDDYFHFQVSLPEELATTKREILSEISRLFDPLGLVGPILVVAKLFMRQLWSLKVEWDQAVPDDVMSDWLKYRSSLQKLNELRAKRWLLHNPTTEFEIHGFCDASNSAYGAVIYFRTKDCSGNMKSNIICSKSRIAPMKHVTTPRLELCSALLLSQLLEKTIKAIKIKPSVIHLWTDSSIALSWINTDVARLKEFVGNRVETVQKLTKSCEWHHVNGLENPADIISRGTTPDNMISNSLWWSGPSWLLEPTDFSNDSSQIENSEECLKEMRTTISLVVVKPQCDILRRFSTSQKTFRVVAIWRRYFSNVQALIQQRKPPNDKEPTNDKKLSIKYLNKDPLTVQELNDAMISCVRLVQSESFPSELCDLKSGHSVNRSKSKLVALVPFLDAKGVIRATGRLLKSNLDSDAMQPIIMPSKHPFMIVLARDEHIQNLHAGPTQILSGLRQRFWPLRGRDLCRHVYNNCITCFRAGPKPIVQRMGQLPGARVQQSRPFINVGVDYAGPVYVKGGLTRNAAKVKAYISLFVCMSTKAVHLELVHTLTSNAFIAALKRFSSRRGKPSDVFSDNGRNFVGAKREMAEFFEWLSTEKLQENLTKTLSNQGITWHFNPPYAPHRGGLWEALVKRTKFHLSRLTDDHVLTFEEMTTLLCEIEAILNSRPLMPLSSDVNDVNVLTPGHFLIGHSLTQRPEADILTMPMSLRTRWHLISELKERFWHRWQEDYLPTLQLIRNDWVSKPVDVKVGDLVVVQADNQKIGEWPLGRITSLHHSGDKIVRTVQILVKGKIISRAVQRICLLPIEE